MFKERGVFLKDNRIGCNQIVASIVSQSEVRNMRYKFLDYIYIERILYD